MKLALLLLALAGCTMERPQPLSTSEGRGQPWFCEDYEAEGERAPKGCVREPGRDDIIASRSEWEAIEFRLCGENGSVSRDDDGPVCSDQWRELVCTGPTENIPDDDPAIKLFREDTREALESVKVALAIERVNSCD